SEGELLGSVHPTIPVLDPEVGVDHQEVQDSQPSEVTSNKPSAWEIFRDALSKIDLTKSREQREAESTAAFERAGAKHAEAQARAQRYLDAAGDLGNSLGGVLAGGVIGGLAQAKTHVTYLFRDQAGNVRYVGRASGQGNPLEVLWNRIRKGHHV